MAADGLKLEIEGIEEAVDAFLEFQTKLQKKALRNGTRAGAKIVQADAVAYAPEDQGDLVASIKVRAARGEKGKRLPRTMVGHSVVAGQWGKHKAFWARFQELGTEHLGAKNFMRDGLWNNTRPVIGAIIKEIKALSKSMKE